MCAMCFYPFSVAISRGLSSRAALSFEFVRMLAQMMRPHHSLIDNDRLAFLAQRIHSHPEAREGSCIMVVNSIRSDYGRWCASASTTTRSQAADALLPDTLQKAGHGWKADADDGQVAFD